MAEYDVFVSYSKKDADFVRSLVAALEARGVRVWYDGGEIRIGESFMRRIEDALEQSRYFLPVISPDYLSGQWTPFELGVALSAASTKEAYIIYVLVRESDLSALPRPLRRHQFLNATQASAEQIAAQVAAIIEFAAEVAEAMRQIKQDKLAENPDSPETVNVSSDTKQ